MQDGHYRIKNKSDAGWTTTGELRTEDGIQLLRIVGFDEALDPEEFDIDSEPISMD